MKYDELIKSLKICADDLALSCNGCMHDNTTELHCKFQLMKEAADAIEELQKPKWISVGERLPRQYEDVLVSAKEMPKPIVAWRGLSGFRDAVGAPLDVTHWMPLPDPPKEGK